jgi:hypothetical protein
MGNLYVNIALNTSDRDRIAAVLADTQDRGVILAPENGWTILSSEALETQDERFVEQYGTSLSRGGVPVLAVMNHDDDILMVFLYQAGARTAFANTRPGYFADEDRPPVVEGVEALAWLADGVAAGDIADLLTRDHVFAVDAHGELARLLGLPAISVGFGYDRYRRDEFEVAEVLEFGK